MATTVRTRLTASEGRRFGFTLGGAFLVLALLAWWRGRMGIVGGTGIIAGSLLLAALVIPTHLGPVERAWMAFARALSRVTTPIVMAVLYFGLLTPIAIVRLLFVHNPIVQRPTTTGYWKPRVSGHRRSSLERQF